MSTIGFNSNELDRLAILLDLAAEFRALVPEIELASKQLPILQADQKSLDANLHKIPPSQLLAFGEDVRKMMEVQQRTEFLRGALVCSQSALGSRLAMVKASLSRELREVSQFTLARIDAALSGDPRAQARNRVNRPAGETLADKAESLLTICGEFGAILPEATPQAA